LKSAAGLAVVESKEKPLRVQERCYDWKGLYGARVNTLECHLYLPVQTIH
jgi:hypothetical protein